MKKIIMASGPVRYLYHSVDDRGYEFVKKHGLVPDSDGFVYLSEHPMKNSNYTHTFKVQVPDEHKLYDWSDFWTDKDGNEIDYDHEADPFNPYFIYTGPIGTKYLQEV